ncbi:MAG: hypothetical protein HQL22_09900 [Candidatus Omnitrophica bacterium]|nr:hypothetical protein [Candidatus Omnitrophota bacterium]
MSCVEFLRRPSFLIPFSFVIWLVLFWGFLSGQISLTSDAISYYDHTKFFLDQLGRGQFPLWDPNWSGGVPNDFFLRRIGPYNPFLLIILVLNKCGLHFFYAYMVFQAGYFFFGMTGFYFLCRKLLQDESASFLSFLILLFSALGTRMFDSYMLLVTIPTIWFFYFLVSFFVEPKKSYAAGLSLAVMFLLTTYIPLYFLITFMFFVLVYIMVFWRDLPSRTLAVVDFVNKNRFFTLLCLAALLLASLPALTFYNDAGKGGIALPGRHYNTEARHVLTVEPQQLNPWSIAEEFFFASYFTDLKRIAFAIVYVPLFSFLVLGAGIFIRLSRLFVMLFIWAALLLLFSMPIGFPLYDFLFKHVFFVKYFRNLHFLLWFALLPIFALFVGEVWKRILELRQEKGLLGLVIVVLTLHYLAFLLIMWQGDALLSTYISLGLSAIVWGLLLSSLDWPKRWSLVLLLAVVILQPLEVFHYLSQNSTKGKPVFSYDSISEKFEYVTSTSGEIRLPSNTDLILTDVSGLPPVSYFCTDIYNKLRLSVDAGTLERYEHYKFYLYDHQPPANDLSGAFAGVPVKSDSDHFRVVQFSVNSVTIKADIDSPRFVVFNDVIYPGWTLTINGKIKPLLTSNGAFKGFWLPSGKSVAVIKFGSWKRFLFNWSVLGVFYGMFLWTIFLFRRRLY